METDGTPFIFWNNAWSPICGLYFWDSSYGASLFCKKLGYSSGTSKKSNQMYDVNSFKVGKCLWDDSWGACTGGCNDYSSGGNCINENSAKTCDANDDQVGITIECNDGGQDVKNSSCGGNFLIQVLIYVDD